MLDVSHVVAACHATGLRTRCDLSSVPQALRTSSNRTLLFTELERLLTRRPQEQQRALELISTCAIFLANDGGLWPSKDICAGDSKSVVLISKICPEIPFSTGEVHQTAPTVELAVPRLSAAAVIGYMERRPFTLDRAAAPSLLRWFEARKDDFEGTRELSARLAALPLPCHFLRHSAYRRHLCGAAACGQHRPFHTSSRRSLEP